MKIYSTITLTLTLITMMIGSGAVSAYWGFNLGSDSLKGVTQPDDNPARKLVKNPDGSGERSQFRIIPEQEILARVQAQVHGEQPPVAQPQSAVVNVVDTNPEDPAAIAPEETQGPKTFPLFSSDRQITLEIEGLRQESSSLLLDVALTNEGDQAAKFLYSFLEVTDDNDQALSAITNGLPGELPANDQRYQGTIRIPMVLLGSTETISLHLTDYPEQRLKLNIAQIPVK